jgi:putative flavoprotein involved in K+ transport
VAERIETVVVGAGQAGLATSFHLSQRGREHVILERGEVADTWRTKRWDGFYLNTPKFTQLLPGLGYRGPDPDGFSSLAETIAYFDEYASLIEAPVRSGVAVTALRAGTRGLELETSDDEVLEATNVVVATGAYQRATPNALAGSAPDGMFQLHAVAYRRPDDLPDGAVLVVGGGQSGCQIADELMRSGRTVYLSVGRCPSAPRRYRGRDFSYWFMHSGFGDQTVDTLPSPAVRLLCNVPISGNDGGHDCHPRWLAERGAILVGRLVGLDGPTVRFSPELEADLAWGDERRAVILRTFDEYIAASGISAPEAEPPEALSPVQPIEQLDTREAGITTVLWSNGYRPDYGWIELPLFDEYGWPIQTRGVTSVPGVYFVGVHWLHKRKSSLIFGVGEDAEYVVEHLSGGQA